MVQRPESEFSLWRLFLIFAKIGAFTIGGGYAMIPVIESEMKRRGWIEEDEFEDLIVLAQSAPGLLAVNIAIFTGHRLRGLKGSIVATLGAIAPSFFIMLTVAALFTQIRDNDIVRRIFQGIRPVAVALIIVPAVRMFRKGAGKWWYWLITFPTLFFVAFLKVSPVWILLVTIVLSLSVIKLLDSRRQ